MKLQFIFFLLACHGCDKSCTAVRAVISTVWCGSGVVWASVLQCRWGQKSTFVFHPHYPMMLTEMIYLCAPWACYFSDLWDIFHQVCYQPTEKLSISVWLGNQQPTSATTSGRFYPWPQIVALGLLSVPFSITSWTREREVTFKSRWWGVSVQTAAWRGCPHPFEPSSWRTD